MLTTLLVTLPLVFAPQEDTQDPAWVAQLRRDIARIQLQLTTDRDHPTALTELREAGSVFDGNIEKLPLALQQAILVEYVATYASVAAEGGQLAEAIGILELALEPDEDDRDHPAARALAALPKESPLHDQLRRLRAQRDAALGGDPQDEIDRAVMSALKSGNYRFIEELGPRAARGLAADVRQTLGTLPTREYQDSLTLLMRFDPDAADALVGEIGDFDSFYWKRRIIRSLEAAKLFDRDDIWEATVGPERRSRLTHLDLALDRLITEPDLAPSVFELILAHSFRGSLTPAMNAALVRAVSANPNSPAAPVLYRPDRALAPRLAPLRQLLASANEGARVLALVELLEFPSNEGLYALAEDPSPGVRVTLALALGERKVRVWDATAREWREEAFLSPLDDAYRACLDRLLDDPDSAVVIAAWKACRTLPWRRETVALPRWDPQEEEHTREHRYMPDVISAARLAALARHPSAEVREAVADAIYSLPKGTRAQAALVLASDSEASVVRALESSFDDLEWHTQPLDYLPALRALLANPTLPSDRVDNWLQFTAYACSHTPEGLAAFTDYALEDESGKRASSLVDSAWGKPVLDAIGHLDPARFAALATHPALVANGRAARLLSAARTDEQRLALAERAGRLPITPELRVLGACAHPDPGAGPVSLMLREALAAGYSFETRGPYGPSFAERWRALSPQDRAVILTEILPHPEADGETLAFLVDKRDLDLAEHPRVVELALARWYVGGFETELIRGKQEVNGLFVDCANLPEVVSSELLAEAVRHPDHVDNALDAIAIRRDPEHLALIAELMRANRGKRLFEDAVRALPGYLSDEAAELLLEAAAFAESGETRDWCLEQLEKIREYQEAQERWATRRVRVKQRAEVVAELVTLLDSERSQARVEALRALGTWEAVEAMPRMIRLLEDRDGTVAAAAQAALDRLNGVDR